jgi:ribose 5-phosphate isomerase B
MAATETIRQKDHPDGFPKMSGRAVLSAAAVQSTAIGAELWVAPDTLITPLAREEAERRRITLHVGEEPASARQPAPDSASTTDPARHVALGADHGGFELKTLLKAYLVELGYTVTDVGCFSPEAVDYPDLAYAVARLVADGRATAGIVMDGAGIGSAMVANKVPGVRAALCYDLSTAVNSREHNHANVLTLGAGLIGPALARQIVKTWLETPWGAGRHAKRVDKIMQVEQRFLKS